MKAPLITSFQMAGTMTLSITWSTGEILSVDLSALINRSTALVPLLDPTLFSQAVAEEWGHGIDWPNGLDLGADRLYELGREQAGLFSPARFDRWMNDNKLSLSSAADAIGMTRRMIAHYRSGTRPIPKTVQLACLGWEMLQKQKHHPKAA
jgi:hypothetical protein